MEHDKTYSRRWLIASALLVGTCVGVLGNSMMPVALPSILGHFGARVNIGIWTISVYFLMVAVFMPMFGWFGDRYGYRRTYIGGMAGFVVFSWAAAFAPSFGWLIAFRVAQGICNATTLPSVMGILSQVFPEHQRGGALGFWAAVNGASHGLGPILSGVLINLFNWRATFIFIGLLTFLGLLLLACLVPPDRKKESRPFDWLGTGTFTFAILSFLLNLSHIGKAGWPAWISYSLWGAFLVMAAGFVITASRSAHPFIDLTLFSNRVYAVLVAIAGVQFFCLIGFQILMPFYLITLRGLSEVAAGPLIALLPVTLAVFSPVAGRIVDRKGLHKTIRMGMLVITATAASTLFWLGKPPLWIIGGTLVCMGLGMGLIQSPTAAGVTLVVPKKQLGVALGIFNTLRFISVTLSATLCGVILDPFSVGPDLRGSGFQWGFLLLAAVAGGGALLAVLSASLQKQSEN